MIFRVDDYILILKFKKKSEKCNGPAGIRTQDLTVISRALYRLSHGPLKYKRGIYFNYNGKIVQNNMGVDSTFTLHRIYPFLSISNFHRGYQPLHAILL